MAVSNDLDTSQIREWRSIITLIVFVLTNLAVLFPFHIPLFVPLAIRNGFLDVAGALRIIPPRSQQTVSTPGGQAARKNIRLAGISWKRFNFPMDFVTAPLIADLFLLAILAIGRQEVHDGTVGADNISPIDIMVFFLSLAYIAISIDASGLIRYLAFVVLRKAGKNGHLLYFYLYTFFFSLTAFVGNDPVVLSGTAFLAYMTRVSSNIQHPRAWIYAQFSVANIGSAILVSSNPTNLVLSGAFEIKFIHYTANVIVPVVVTAIVLFPFLLYVVFPNESLIPHSIKLHELPEEVRGRDPINPNIPNARGDVISDDHMDDEQARISSLEEIMNPFLDKGGAWFGAVLMAATLITILALNASSANGSEHPVFWITLPAAFIMFCWDITFGWLGRKETRSIARNGREEITRARAQRAEEARRHGIPDEKKIEATSPPHPCAGVDDQSGSRGRVNEDISGSSGIAPEHASTSPTTSSNIERDEKHNLPGSPPKTLSSILAEAYQWAQETFPIVMTVASHLPFKLVPFALCMFVLVQALVTKGWVAVFAHGWDHWVNKTGTVGAVGGMAFLAVVLCNFAGTNIGTAILLCRVVQAWIDIHRNNGAPISQRTFWATVYSMTFGLNYGAFSTTFSASLAGMLWRDILARKHIYVRGLDFARINAPIIAVATIVGSAVLIGEVYITRNTKPYNLG
ncbi:hypothetical protein DOTSEDRAFT_154807 [Dothistroma septosporum NZE10]|uniref:Citrate transporter-like domain-containing protein n=1 Tax=Dothistroma septosporum (strain NZE10 / CBS 128990) TaxID=675120 RepID=N1PIL6_DOTSN|nr:hypothetical protein DOTSEDRAFT_154807 [Dothistroma septosporum NZE10]